MMTKGKDNMKIHYRLSPNEVEQLQKEETARRRKLRLVQVREQAKANAAQIREDVKKERRKQLNKLECEIKNNLEKEKQEKLRRLEQQYENSLKNIGAAHKAARNVKDSHVERERQELRQKEAAENRYQSALKKERKERAVQDYQENKHILFRKAALETETLRAAEVASLPPPPPDPIEEVLRSKLKPVPMTDMNAFSTTHYHMPDYAVVKAGPCEQTNAIEAGEEEDYRLQLQLKEKKQSEQDQIVRARIRGNQALKKEHLRHEYSNMLQDLSLLQRADRRRRQEEVADLPKQVFVPPDRRLEEKENKQRDMEKAFEDMYLADRHPAVLMTLDGQSPPDTPSTTESGDTPQQLLSQTASKDVSALRDVTNVTGSEQTSKLKPNETALMKLFNRIKQQKEEHATRSALETSQIGDFPAKPVLEPRASQLQEESNGLSPLSEYSLPPPNSKGITPVEDDVPRQVHIEIASPQARSKISPHKKVPSPQKDLSDAEKQVWQEKIVQLETKQKELDSLISKFKNMTGAEDPGEGQGLRTSSAGGASAAVPGIAVRETLTFGHVLGQTTKPEPHPSGIYHARPVHITAKGEAAGLESGYFSGHPTGTFQSVRGPSVGSGATSGFYGTHLNPQEMASHSASLATQADRLRKVREYQEKILQSSQRDTSLPQAGLMSDQSSLFGSSTDSDLARKVKDYQMKILEGNADRRNFLAETKAAIERQRRELYRKYPLTMGTNVNGEFTVSSEAVPVLTSEAQEESVADRILAQLQGQGNESDLAGSKPVPEKLSESQSSANTSKARLERIRKSLLFDDPEESLSRTPGHDFSILAPSDIDDGDMTLTSSSERGSPNLSKSQKSDLSVGAMSLITRAKETGDIFEKRQQELQKQLEEVQRQKDEILYKYQVGQQRILDSRTALSRKNDSYGSSQDLSRTWKSVLSDPQDVSFPSLRSEGNLRSASGLKDKSSSLDQKDFSVSTLSDFPKSLEQLSLQDSSSRLFQTSVDISKPFSMDLEEESLSQVSSNVSPATALDKSGNAVGGAAVMPGIDNLFSGSKYDVVDAGALLSLEEESLSPESRQSLSGSELSKDHDRITWAHLLTGVPTTSGDETPAFQVVDFQPGVHVPHELSTIFEVDTPTPTVRASSEFRALLASNVESL